MQSNRAFGIGACMPSHPLFRYLKKNKISFREFARRSGVDHASLSLVFSGKRNFGVENALRIQLATDGVVTFKQACGRPMPGATPKRKRVA